METIKSIKKDESGEYVLSVKTEHYEVTFPEIKRPTKDHHLQEGDAFRFDCQSRGGTPLYPLITIHKPGLEDPIYAEIANSGCIQSTVQ